jgi:hypothetical protein
VLLTILPAGVAAAAEPPAAHQYVESVPPTSGDRGSEAGPPPAGSSLPGGLDRRATSEAGPDAAALEAIATSPSLGAPSTVGARAGGADSRKNRESPDADPSTLEAATSVPSQDEDDTIAILVAGLAVVSVLAAAAAIARRKSQSR